MFHFRYLATTNISQFPRLSKTLQVLKISNMAPIEKKRRHTGTQISSRKKSKADRQIGHGSGAGPGASGSLDTLPWDEVQFPETFQDAGGFGGLEEISDIEVVRHLGKLEFKVHLVSLDFSLGKILTRLYSYHLMSLKRMVKAERHSLAERLSIMKVSETGVLIRLRWVGKALRDLGQN